MVLDQIANALAPYVGFIIGGIIAAVAAFGAQIISDRGEDRRLRIQLFNAETKRAIEKLYELVNTTMDMKEPDQWRWRIFQYLKSFEAQAYLPLEVRTWAQRELDQNFWNQLTETWPDNYMTPEDEAELTQAEEEAVDYLDEIQLLEYNFEQYWKKLQAGASAQLIAAVYGLAKPKGPKLRSKVRARLRWPRGIRFWRRRQATNQ